MLPTRWTRLRKELTAEYLRQPSNPSDSDVEDEADYIEARLLSYLLTAAAVREVDGVGGELRGYDQKQSCAYRLRMNDERRHVKFALTILPRGPPCETTLIEEIRRLAENFPPLREDIARAISCSFAHGLPEDKPETSAGFWRRIDEWNRRRALHEADPLYPEPEYEPPSVLAEYAPIGPWHAGEHVLSAYLHKAKAPGERLSDVMLRLADKVPGEVTLYRVEKSSPT